VLSLPLLLPELPVLLLFKFLAFIIFFFSLYSFLHFSWSIFLIGVKDDFDIMDGVSR